MLSEKLVAIIWFSLLTGFVQACHYSCKTCFGSSYTSCTSCVGDSPLTIVSPSDITSQTTGLCVGPSSSFPNGLGLFILLISLVLMPLLRNPQIFFIVTALQSLSLFGLLQIAWVSSAGFLIDSLAYLMPFNLLITNTKTLSSELTSRGYYRLHSFLRTPNYSQNIVFIGVVFLVVVISFVVWFSFYYRRRQQEIDRKDKDQGDSTTSRNLLNEPKPLLCDRLSLWLLKFIVSGHLYCILLLIQEMALVLYTSIVFERPLPIGVLVIAFLGLIAIVVLCVLGYFVRIELYPTKTCFYINVVKKALLPLFVVLPVQRHFVMLIFYLVIIFIESSFDYNSKVYSTFNRILIYKGGELVCAVSMLAYYFVQNYGTSSGPTQILSGFISFFIAGFISFLLLEAVLGIREKFFAGEQVSPEARNKLETSSFNQTQENIFDNKQQFQQEKLQKIDLAQLESRPSKRIINADPNINHHSELNLEVQDKDPKVDMNPNKDIYVIDMQDAEKQAEDSTDKTKSSEGDLKPQTQPQQQVANSSNQPASSQLVETQLQPMPQRRRRKPNIDPELRKRYGL